MDGDRFSNDNRFSNDDRFSNDEHVPSSFRAFDAVESQFGATRREQPDTGQGVGSVRG